VGRGGLGAIGQEIAMSDSTVSNQSEVLPLIRAQVRDRLTRSAAFMAMSPEQRQQVAHDTVNALHYIVAGEDGKSQPTSMTLAGNAEAFAGGVGAPRPGAPLPKETTASPAPQKRTSLAHEGGEAFADVVERVNFPAFVGGLIDGVFNSIVTTSIKQMEAYAEMVKNVSKSVDQYMKDNVTENHARDYLAERYPDHLEMDLAGEAPRLKPKDTADDSNMPDFFADLGLKTPMSSLDEDNVEKELVPAARHRIAMDRQQLLATMVMMGVNRLVVTNGTIEASCFFELDTTDMRKRHATASSFADRTAQRTSESGSNVDTKRHHEYSGKWEGRQNQHTNSSSGDWKGSYDRNANWYSKATSNETATFRVATASTRDSEETIKMHAELGGKVKVNFKSDYFPMEKMIDALQVNQIRDKTAAGIAPQPAQTLQPQALPAPALPGLPAMPGAPALPAAPAGPR
jgi:hypothetical protein